MSVNWRGSLSKVLITGANGQLGRNLKAQLREKNAELILTDVADLDSKVYDFVHETGPDVILNCVAHTAVDKCETDEDSAFKINSISPKNLAQAAFNVGEEIVQISQIMFLMAKVVNL